MLQNAYTLRNEDFISVVDVKCPKCKSKAVVLGGIPSQFVENYEDDVQFSCISCGFALKYKDIPKTTLFTNSRGKNIKSRVMIVNSPYDPFFRYEVWYTTETKFGILWAYNLEHLSVIENYIADQLRSRNGLPYKNNSIGSRLPQWVKDAKNRVYLLKIITKLKNL